MLCVCTSSAGNGFVLVLFFADADVHVPASDVMLPCAADCFWAAVLLRLCFFFLAGVLCALFPLVFDGELLSASWAPAVVVVRGDSPSTKLTTNRGSSKSNCWFPTVTTAFTVCSLSSAAAVILWRIVSVLSSAVVTSRPCASGWSSGTVTISMYMGVLSSTPSSLPVTAELLFLLIVTL